MSKNLPDFLSKIRKSWRSNRQTINKDWKSDQEFNTNPWSLTVFSTGRYGHISCQNSRRDRAFCIQPFLLWMQEPANPSAAVPTPQLSLADKHLPVERQIVVFLHFGGADMQVLLSFDTAGLFPPCCWVFGVDIFRYAVHLQKDEVPFPFNIAFCCTLSVWISWWPMH